MSSPVFASVDLGAAWVKVVIGTLDERGRMKIKGFGRASSTGVRRGVVVDLKNAARSLSDAWNMAAGMADCQTSRVAVSISGEHISCMNSSGEISLGADAGSQGYAVELHHLETALSHARSVHLSVDKCLLHTIPQCFHLDGKRVEDPVGLTGHRLRVDAHLILSSITSRDNLLEVLELAGLEPGRIVFSPLADSVVVLRPEDLKRGVALLNIGAGSSDSVFFWDGGLHHSRVERFAAGHINRDVAMLMKTTQLEASELVRKKGTVDEMDADEELTVLHVQGTGRQSVHRRQLSQVIQARASEILKSVVDEARLMHARDRLQAGLVLTGGAAGIHGMPMLASQVTQMRSRMGFVTCFKGLNDTLGDPEYTTCVGLLAMEAGEQEDFDRDSVPMLDHIRLYQSDADGGGRGKWKGLGRMFGWRRA